MVNKKGLVRGKTTTRGKNEIATEEGNRKSCTSCSCYEANQNDHENERQTSSQTEEIDVEKEKADQCTKIYGGQAI